MTSKYENAVSFSWQLWSPSIEIDTVIDKIFEECRDLGWIVRERNQKACLKVILLNVYIAYKTDPTCYVRYSRKNQAWKKRYNALVLSSEQIRTITDWLTKLEYIEGVLGFWSPIEVERRQSRMKATIKLIAIFEESGASPVMISRHENAETIILKDKNKKLIDYVDTDETLRMRMELKIINDLLSKTLINLYIPDDDLRRLHLRLKLKEKLEKHYEYDSKVQEQDETEVRTLDFTRKTLVRIFNNNNFRHGGRLYGGWWQGVPNRPKKYDTMKYRKYIRINHMNTVEVDFSAMHINLIYWRQGLSVPEGDLYTLDGFPEGTRKVVKLALLTLINAKSRKKGLKSIQEHINGFKIRAKTVKGKREKMRIPIDDDDRIILPPGVKIETIITAFEKKHEAINDWFFSGKGVELQYWDSEIAMKILLKLAKQGVPCLPLHDSFIVSFPQARGLREIMSDAFYEVTGRYPNMDAKMSLTEENEERGEEKMEEDFNQKMTEKGRFSEKFKKQFSIYFKSITEWKQVTGKDNIFVYSKSMKLNRETYH